MATPAICLSCGLERDYPARRGDRLADMRCVCGGELARAGRNPSRAARRARSQHGTCDACLEPIRKCVSRAFTDLRAPIKCCSDCSHGPVRGYCAKCGEIIHGPEETAHNGHCGQCQAAIYGNPSSCPACRFPFSPAG